MASCRSVPTLLFLAFLWMSSANSLKEFTFSTTTFVSVSSLSGLGKLVEELDSKSALLHAFPSSTATPSSYTSLGNQLKDFGGHLLAIAKDPTAQIAGSTLFTIYGILSFLDAVIDHTTFVRSLPLFLTELREIDNELNRIEQHHLKKLEATVLEILPNLLDLSHGIPRGTVLKMQVFDAQLSVVKDRLAVVNATLTHMRQHFLAVRDKADLQCGWLTWVGMGGVVFTVTAAAVGPMAVTTLLGVGTYFAFKGAAYQYMITEDCERMLEAIRERHTRLENLVDDCTTNERSVQRSLDRIF